MSVSAASKALDLRFSAYGVNLQNVEVFKYLGRLLAYDDVDTQATMSNIRKARRVWARISAVLRAENASPRVCGMFYKITVQSVLLFGSETWILTPITLERLEGFHVKAARRMTGKMPVSAHGIWMYPKTSEVLAAACLCNIEHYVRVLRARILKLVEARPIYQLCQRAVRRRGTPPRTF